MIKIALAGYGYWGPNVARNIYNNKNYDFKYICDLKEERLELARQLYANDIQYTTDFEEILHSDVDAVALAVETSAHFEMGKKVIESGKHLYVEKPFMDTVKQAEEIKRLAEEYKVFTHIDHIMIYHPAIRKIKEIIDSGELGDVIYFDCSRLNLGRVKNDVSCMWDLSVHDLSIIEYLSNGAQIQSVKAIGKRMYSKRESVTFLMADYGNFIVNIKANWISPIKERKLIVAGTKKMLVYDDVDVVNKLIIYDKGFEIIKEDNPMEYNEFVVKSRIGDAVIPKLEVSDALYNSLECFRLCIKEGKKSLSDPDAAIRVLKVLEMADSNMTVV